MDLSTIVLIASEIATLVAIIVPVIVWARRIIEGIRCQLRSDMLHTYYKHLEENCLKQYELEHFIKCYQAYKALKGNSFIDEINKTVRTWKVVH